MRHPDGTPYWEPTPIGPDASAEADYFASERTLRSKGGAFLCKGTLTECAENYDGLTINYRA